MGQSGVSDTRLSFLLDPWWNPAVKAQAVDRAHRIGQRPAIRVGGQICESVTLANES
jgi:hypothetical protein